MNYLLKVLKVDFKKCLIEIFKFLISTIHKIFYINKFDLIFQNAILQTDIPTEILELIQNDKVSSQ